MQALDAASRMNSTEALASAAAHAFSAGAALNLVALDDATGATARSALRATCLQMLLSAIEIHGGYATATAATLLAATAAQVRASTTHVWPPLSTEAVLARARQRIASTTLATAADATSALLAVPMEATASALADGVLVLEAILALAVALQGPLDGKVLSSFARAVSTSMAVVSSRVHPPSELGSDDAPTAYLPYAHMANRLAGMLQLLAVEVLGTGQLLGLADSVQPLSRYVSEDGVGVHALLGVPCDPSIRPALLSLSVPSRHGRVGGTLEISTMNVCDFGVGLEIFDFHAADHPPRGNLRRLQKQAIMDAKIKPSATPHSPPPPPPSPPPPLPPPPSPPPPSMLTPSLPPPWPTPVSQRRAAARRLQTAGANGCLCSNTCHFPADNLCDDGGSPSSFD